MPRQSSRKPKPIQREGFVKLTKDIIVEMEEELKEKMKREQEEYNREISASNQPSTSSDPPRRPTPPPYIKRCNDSFTPEGSQAIFNFILGRIRSKNPDRFGRVAKRRVELMRNDFWEKCRIAMGSEREAISYRNHFNSFARQLHIYDGISLLDKVDLYYALDIKPDPSIRQRLIQNFEVHFDDSGLISGSDLLDHWDLIHPDSEPEDDEDGFSREYDGNRYTEYDDGLMWQFIVDDVNSDNVRESYTTSVWKDFKRRNKKYSRIGRCTESYKSRFEKILLPNLHKMPFDLVTKAVLFYKLGYAVPMEFRSAILAETSATLDEEGFIADFPSCPDRIVLQSHPYNNTVIGISSTSRLSSLKAPTSWADTLPYTPEEDKQIWQYIVFRSQVNGKCQKIKEKMSGWAFWKQFQRDCKTERSWKSLSEHFMEDLRGTIMDLHYDLKTKMELYFALSVPVEEEALAEFRSIAVVILAKGYMIKYAAGKKFSIGRKDNLNHEEKELVDHNEMDFGKKNEILKNNERFPYLNLPQRSIEACRKRKELMAEVEDVLKRIRPNTPESTSHLAPKLEEEPLEEQKPTDLLPPPEDDVKLEPIPQDFPVKQEEENIMDPPPILEPAISPPPLQPTIIYASEVARSPVPYCPRIPTKHRGPPPPYIPRIDTRIRAFLKTDNKVVRRGAIPQRNGTPPPYLGPSVLRKTVVEPIPGPPGPPGPGIPYFGPSGAKKVAVRSVAVRKADPPRLVPYGLGIPYHGPYGIKKATFGPVPAGPGIPYIGPSKGRKSAGYIGSSGSRILDHGPSGVKKDVLEPKEPVGSSGSGSLDHDPSGVKQLIKGSQTTILNRVTGSEEAPKIEDPEPEVKEDPDATGSMEDAPEVTKIEVEEPDVKMEMMEIPEDLEQLTAAVLASMNPEEEIKPDIGGGLFEDHRSGGLFEEQDPTSSHIPYPALPPRPAGPVAWQGCKKGTRVPRILRKAVIKPRNEEQHKRDEALRIAGRAPNVHIKPALLLAASLSDIRNNRKEEQRERDQELRAGRTPNLQIKPALLLAANLPDIRNRSSPPKYFSNQTPEDRVRKAFSDVEDHLKTFTKEMEAIRPYLKKKERESCMQKMMSSGTLQGASQRRQDVTHQGDSRGS